MEGIEVALQATVLARTPTRLPPTETPIRPTSSHTAQPSATSTPIPTNTPLPSLTPTYSVLRGYVVPAQVSCRYGPGAVYLYKYGLVGGSRLEIIGRLPDASWILIQAIGGDNPCWVNAELFDIEGDVISVAPVDVHVVMAWSPYYSALTGVSASRTEDTVTVFWDLLILRAGDDSGQIPYVVEAWTCVNGQIEFNAIGSWTFAAEIQDEKGCAEPSYARVFAAEKHGYTQWVVVPIPPHPTP
jgi:hypothetical protein